AVCLLTPEPSAPLKEETEDSIMSPIPVGPPSPLHNSEDFTPKEASPYEAPVYIPEDIPIPSDLELRESSIPGAGLGIWTKKPIRIGEKFGPYTGMQSSLMKEAGFNWEVSENESLHLVGFKHECILQLVISNKKKHRVILLGFAAIPHDL
uniref:Si:ch211-263k4.2 n=1 Tax=Erpetoichthys calabaricus TaxID=27687 RepID=A0A8C4RZD9_ERPCA